jgi:two-component system sensor histidine kinase TctE
VSRRPPRAHWLQRELTLRLMLPLLSIMLATAALGTYTAHQVADRMFDRWLFDAAQSAAVLVRFADGRAQLDLPTAAEQLLLYDEGDRTWFNVTYDGHVLAGEPGIPVSGERERASRQGDAYDALFDGQEVRVAHVSVSDGGGHHADVRVAETQGKRAHVTRELETVLLPMALLMLAAAVAILLAVRRTVQPLERIAAQWRLQSHQSLAPIEDADLPRELTPFAVALNDLLARMRALLARERQFAADAAHQLRTPLAGLQLGLARAAESPDLATTREVIGELSQATQRAARLAQQLLAIGRLDPERRAGLETSAADLVALAQDVGGAHADQALEQAIELELVAATQPVWARVQPDLIAEALSNLIDNAMRYTPPGGQVQVEVADDPPRLTVADSGPGIAEDEREAVLERFTRGRNARGDGSGLGLAIVRDIAAMHGAQLRLGDSAWGGASVSIVFEPMRANANASAGANHASERGPDAHTPTRGADAA